MLQIVVEWRRWRGSTIPISPPNLSPTLTLDITVLRESIEQAATAESDSAFPMLCWLPIFTAVSHTRQTSPLPSLAIGASSPTRFFLYDAEAPFCKDLTKAKDSLGQRTEFDGATIPPCWVSATVVPPSHTTHRRQSLASSSEFFFLYPE